MGSICHIIIFSILCHYKSVSLLYSYILIFKLLLLLLLLLLLFSISINIIIIIIVIPRRFAGAGGACLFKHSSI